ncbi:MAG: dihydropteroate synthase [Mucinivorans sp.]
MQEHQIWTIINATPDSFWQGSRAQTSEQITFSARQAIDSGASVLDLGGMSTRPGYTEISSEEEYARLRIAVGAVRSVAADFPISIDTYRSEVVRRIFDEFGIITVNDISGGELDEDMFATLGERGLDYVMMSRNDTMENMIRFFDLNIGLAQRAGVKNIIIDPGFGFGKSVAQNFQILGSMDRLRQFGLPILVGLSRKSMIWRTLDTSPDDALNGTLVLEFEALARGADILRVHDTPQTAQIIKLYETYNSNRR